MRVCLHDNLLRRVCRADRLESQISGGSGPWGYPDWIVKAVGGHTGCLLAGNHAGAGGLAKPFGIVAACEDPWNGDPSGRRNNRRL